MKTCLLLQLKGELKRIYLGRIPDNYILPKQTKYGYFTKGTILNPEKNDLNDLIIKCHNTNEDYIYLEGNTFKLK